MRIGILGGGQLGQMLALAGIPLGYRFTFLDPNPDAVAAAVGTHIRGDYDDPAALRAFLGSVDVVTFEFENVPASALERIASLASIPIRPGVEALRIGQDRLFEKTLFREVGLHVPEFQVAADPDQLRSAVAKVGTPCVVKSRRMGYDGKGQAVVRSLQDADAAWRTISPQPPGVIVEAFVPFQRELSILAVRSAAGDFAAYPLVENRHEAGILRRSIAPAPGVSSTLQMQAEAHARAIMDRLGYVGVLAIELFDVEGTLLGNEMAPRVHNSGHWTIEGSVCSQFENHVRAVAGETLGSTAMRAYAAGMVNLIGVGRETLADAVRRHPALAAHWYGKDPRPGRKVGHLTLTGHDADAVRLSCEAIEAAVSVLQQPVSKSVMKSS
jgi:5-(carboxyamino)imidazole ribonucleotide synthase